MIISGILLAAGASRRFGADKLAHPLPDGGTALARSLATLAAAVDEVVVVLRPGAIPAALDAMPQARPVFCRQAARGMGASLAAGVRAAPAGGIVVALADMPFVREDTVRAVAAALRGGALAAAPFHAGRRGHPVGLAPCYRPLLLGLDGDAGARRLLDAIGAGLARLPVDDPGALHDIDTPDDLAFGRQTTQ